MTISSEDIPLLRPWLVKRSAEVSEAEPEVLADYIIALLNNQVQGDELVKLLESELAEFLDDNVSQFAKEISDNVASRAFATGVSLDEIRKKAQQEAIELSKEHFRPDPTSYNQAPPDYKRKIRRASNLNHSSSDVNTLKQRQNESQEQRQREHDHLNKVAIAAEVPRAKHLIVSNLPQDKLNEGSIRGYFTRFGVIERVNINHYNRYAEIEFQDSRCARKAWSSPTPIFDNRFIKIFFRRKDAENPDALGPEEDEEKEEVKPFDIEEFKQKQLEKQREFEAKQAKKREVDGKLQKMIELKEKMLVGYENDLKNLEEELKSNPSKEEEIRNKVLAIQKQMEENGVTPEAISFDKARLEGKVSSFRGRGRGGRVLRGGNRGRGGKFNPYQRPAVKGSYNKQLDFRTRTITLLNLDDANNESFKRAVGVFGNDFIEEIGTKEDGKINITFKDRYHAEKFFKERIELDNLPPLEKEWDESKRPSPSIPSSSENGNGSESAESASVTASNISGTDGDVDMSA